MALYAVGRVVKAFGIKGEIVIRSLTASPDRFKTLRKALIGRSEGEAVETQIERASPEPRGIRLKLTTISTRTQAEKLVGMYLFVDERHRLRPGKGTYFVDDIVGLTVVDEQGSRIGTIREVMKLPAQDVYVVDANGREVMIPAVREFIREIDTEAGTMRVRLIEGFVES